MDNIYEISATLNAVDALLIAVENALVQNRINNALELHYILCDKVCDIENAVEKLEIQAGAGAASAESATSNA